MTAKLTGSNEGIRNIENAPAFVAHRMQNSYAIPVVPRRARIQQVLTFG